MNRWSEIDDDGETTRKVGPLTLRAHCYGQISISMDTIYDHEAHLVPAQAAADAACERLLREAMSDFGLVFGPPVNGCRHAVASDGHRYTVDGPTADNPRDAPAYRGRPWIMLPGDDDGEWFATESEAIAAARTHDEQRRGGR